MYGFAAIFFPKKREAFETLTTLTTEAPKAAWFADLVTISKPDGSVMIDRVISGTRNDNDCFHDWGGATFSIIRSFADPAHSEILTEQFARRDKQRQRTLGSRSGSPSIDAFTEALHVNASALALVGCNKTLDDFLSETEPFGAMIVRGDLSKQEIEVVHRKIQSRH